MDKLTFTEILFTVWYSKPLSNKIYIKKSFFFQLYIVCVNFEWQASVLHQETILYMHISRIINPCIIKQGTVHFDFLLQRGAKLVSICVAGQTNAIYRLRCTSLHRGRGISPLVENLNSYSPSSPRRLGAGVARLPARRDTFWEPTTYTMGNGQLRLVLGKLVHTLSGGGVISFPVYFTETVSQKT